MRTIIEVQFTYPGIRTDRYIPAENLTDSQIEDIIKTRIDVEKISGRTIIVKRIRKHEESNIKEVRGYEVTTNKAAKIH